MAIASLFPEVPSLEFQVLDSTSNSPDAASLLSGSTSAGASRPSTAGGFGRQFSDGAKASTINMSSVVQSAMPQAFLVSAADCLHACHAHVTDPENFWKSINDACVFTALAPPTHDDARCRSACRAGTRPPARNKAWCRSWATVWGGSTYSTPCTAMAFIGWIWGRETRGWWRRCWWFSVWRNREKM